MEDEPGVAPRILGWLDGLVVPLQHALGQGEGAVLLGDQGARHEEDPGGALLGVHPVRLPGGRRLDLIGVEDDEPVEVADAITSKPSVWSTYSEVLTEDEAAFHFFVLHPQDRRVVGVVARKAA